MKVQKFALADASFERAPGAGRRFPRGQSGRRAARWADYHWYGRYGPNQNLPDILAAHDVMVVLEGRLSGSTETATAGPGEIVYMPKGAVVTIRSHEDSAVTAYVAYPQSLLRR